MAVALLVVAVVGMFVHPRRVGPWVAPLAAAIVGWASGAIPAHTVGDVAGALWQPLAFLLLAVPVAELLDRLGFFTAAAALADRGTSVHAGLWVLAAAVTTVFNLDASVVLLTPLYVRIAHRRGLDPLSLAVQPVLLAAFASSALPVSNLTNLIAAERWHWSVARFASVLGLPSVAATVVGYVCYRRWVGPVEVGAAAGPPPDRRAVRRGGPVVAFLLLGFTVGDAVGVPAFAVAAVAVVWLLVLCQQRRGLAVPWDAALLAAGLAVVATAASSHLHLDKLVAGGTSVASALGAMGLGVVGACLVNNLPALLVLLPQVPASNAARGGLLLGVNLGPVLVITGALAGLLWRSTAARLGVQLSARRYSGIGALIGVPALAAAAAVHAALTLLR